ncbi:MAG: DNA polymerase III subunit delta [Treponema sp.]|nr:DNA polymerase III subunit delta [Treponema sp.]
MSESIYLYIGPEFGERNDAVAEIKQALKKKYGDIDEHLLYASESSVHEVLTLLQSASLFTSCTCVVLREAELIKKKDEIELLEKWQKNSEDAVLILVSDEFKVDAKLDKIVSSACKKVFWEMFENRKVPWLESFFRKNGYSIQREAAEEILDMVENNTQSLRQECSRFFLIFQKGYTVTLQDVQTVLADSREENVFTLFNTMTLSVMPSQKLEQVLSVLQKIRLSKEASPVMIIAGLASCFRKLQLWHALSSEHGFSETVFKQNGFASKKMREQYERACKTWNVAQCAAILALLSETDMNIRSGGTVFEDVLLQKLLYEIVIKKGIATSVYE